MVTLDALRFGLRHASPAQGPELLEIALKLRDEILRGDVELGLLPPEAAEDLREGFRRAGEAGVPEAWIELGHCHARGIGAACDDLAALEAYRRAAATGAREGVIALVRHLYFYLREPAYTEEAARHAKALLAGDLDGRGHLLLGYLTFQGFGVPEDDAESARLHRIAAERGNADAMFELYAMHATGQGIPRDEAEALRWCTEAAERGHPRATYNMGAFCATGTGGMARDLAQAAAWYERAARAGNGRASAALATMLLRGEGVAADPARAAHWIELAEAQGYPVDELLASCGLSRPR